MYVCLFSWGKGGLHCVTGLDFFIKFCLYIRTHGSELKVCNNLTRKYYLINSIVIRWSYFAYKHTSRRLNWPLLASCFPITWSTYSLIVSLLNSKCPTDRDLILLIFIAQLAFHKLLNEGISHMLQIRVHSQGEVEDLTAWFRYKIIKLFLITYLFNYS